MSVNPYAHLLGSRDARAVLAATPGLAHQAACAMTPEQLDAPIGPPANGVGKWSPRQILAHLADCEIAFSFRLRQILTAPEGQPIAIQPFDQDAWARHYADYDVPSALDFFRAHRTWNLKLLGSLSAADLQRQGNHPERGIVSFTDILETMAGHDLNHLAQLQAIAGTA